MQICPNFIDNEIGFTLASNNEMSCLQNVA